VGVGSVPKELLEGEAPTGKLFDRELPLDGRLDVEFLADVRLLADQLAGLARQLLGGRLARFPEIDGAPALGRLVRDPGLEGQAGDPGPLSRKERLAAVNIGRVA